MQGADAVKVVSQALGGTTESVSEARSLVSKIHDAGDAIEQNRKIIDLTGMEFKKSEISLVDQVSNFFKEIGSKVNRKGFGDVELTRTGVKSSIAHGIGRNKSITFAAVPQIIQNGIEIEAVSNWKGRGYDTHIFAGQVNIDSKANDVGVIVLQDASSYRYYLHEVVAIQKDNTPSNKTGSLPVQSETVFKNGGLQGQTEAGKGVLPITTSIAMDTDTVNPAAGLDLNALAEERMGKPLLQLSESEAQMLQAVADGQDSQFADIFGMTEYFV